jgi:hypothetical protein
MQKMKDKSTSVDCNSTRHLHKSIQKPSKEYTLIDDINKLKIPVLKVVQQIIMRPLSRKDKENKKGSVNTTCDSGHIKRNSISVI